jgi:cell division protein ZapE
MSRFERGLIITPGTDRQLGAYGLFRPAASQLRVLELPSHTLTVKSADPDLLWVGFDALCGGPLGQADYLTLAGMFPAWVVDGVPPPGVEPAGNGAAGTAASAAAAWHRFLDVMDILRDRDIMLVLISRRPLDWDAASRPAAPPSPGAAALAGIADRLAVLRRVESDEQLQDEQTSGC